MNVDLIARNFECYPTNTAASRQLGPLIAQCGEVIFTATIGDSNNNNIQSNLEDRLKARFASQGAHPLELSLSVEIKKEYDFCFEFGDKRFVVEVEKTNRETLLYDFLKFHMYFASGADYALLILPKKYPHSNGIWTLFHDGKEYYDQCLTYGFGNQRRFNRMVLLGYEQFTEDGRPLTPAVRKTLIETKKSQQR